MLNDSLLQSRVLHMTPSYVNWLRITAALKWSSSIFMSTDWLFSSNQSTGWLLRFCWLILSTGSFFLFVIQFLQFNCNSILLLALFLYWETNIYVVRETSVFQHDGGSIKGPFKTPPYDNAVICRRISGSLSIGYQKTMIPKDVSISDSYTSDRCCVFTSWTLRVS